MAPTSTDPTSVEDFQEHRSSREPHAVAQTPHFLSPRASLQQYNHHVESIEQDIFDSNDHESPRHSSDPDEAVFDLSPRHSSPRTSHHSDDDISVLVSGSKHRPSMPERQHSSSPYTPFKTRSPFRNPSSVRAIQLDTTPPPYLTSSTSQPRYNDFIPSRNGTPRSTRSHHSAMRSPSKISPVKKLKKEFPLVLLHVTLLPVSMPYSPAIMQAVLPTYVLENWKLLQEKATDTVLERGILIPHPREDYDLLEERLLESLELKRPRILKCGHFHLDADEEAEVMGSDGEDDDDDNDDADICDDCGRRIRDGRFGSGAGNRRWDLKLYAANGLMRSGAWGAAWREMERVDVEIAPWIDEDMKRELESRRQEEEQHVSETPPRNEQEAVVPTVMDDARMREIYGADPQPFIDGLQDRVDPSPPMTEHQAAPPPPASHPQRPSRTDIPLPTLLRNYLYLAAQDRRNLAIVLLSILVLVLSLGSFSRPPAPRDLVPPRHFVAPLPPPQVDYRRDHPPKYASAMPVVESPPTLSSSSFVAASANPPASSSAAPPPPPPPEPPGPRQQAIPTADEPDGVIPESD